MALREAFAQIGNWLFRWRSYLPLLMAPVFLVALRDYQYPFQSHDLDQIWELICLTICFFGWGIRMLTRGYAPKGTSGRKTYQAAEILNTTGMYSVVRHPLYLGNFFMVFGLVVYLRSGWFTLLYIALFWLYHERIMFAEEEYLRKKFGRAFLDWAEQTPAFIPDFKKWRPPGLVFSFKAAIRSEYSTLFGVIASFTFVEIVEDFFVQEKLIFEVMWAVIFGSGLAVYLTLRILDKRTEILNVESR